MQCAKIFRAWSGSRTRFFGAILGLLALAGYSAPAQAVQAVTAESDYLIGPGDSVNIFVWHNADLSATVAVRPDGSQVSPTNPAQRGETIQLYITGLGQGAPAIATNAVGVPDQTITSTLIVGLNNGGVPLVSAVYGPGLVGIYIVIMQVPADTQTGPYQPIGIVAYDTAKNAYFSQPTYIPIQ